MNIRFNKMLTTLFKICDMPHITDEYADEIIIDINMHNFPSIFERSEWHSILRCSCVLLGALVIATQLPLVNRSQISV